MSSGIGGDAFRQPSAPGSYEWWYFDGYDAAQQTGFICIFFCGIPFSGRRQKSGARRVDDRASDFPALAFSLYGPEGTEAYLVNLHSPDQSRFGPGLEAAVGASSARWNGESYVIQLEDELLDSRSLSGRIVVTPKSLLPDDVHGQNSGHEWIAAAPRCTFDASLRVGGRSLSLHGDAYHDHNVGNGSLQSQFRRWEWGRASFRDESIVYYRSIALDGTVTARFIRVNDRVQVEPLSIDELSHARNVYRLRYASRLRLRAGSSGGDVLVHQGRIVDNGPFYLRFLSSFKRDGEEVVGFSEVLQPAALNWRWFWPLLDSRVRQAHSTDRLGRTITSWLVRRGF